MAPSYLVRYGLSARVGRFVSDAACARGETVVVRSHRGTELGEVLIETPADRTNDHRPEAEEPRVLRTAAPGDLARARAAERERLDWFPACSRIVQEGRWDIELLDLEPLLDDRRVVVHYLGPPRFDPSALVAALRSAIDLDSLFEPVAEGPAEDGTGEAPGCGSEAGCGRCGAGSHGCSAGPRPGHSSACDGCSVIRALTDRS